MKNALLVFLPVFVTGLCGCSSVDGDPLTHETPEGEGPGLSTEFVYPLCNLDDPKRNLKFYYDPPGWVGDTLVVKVYNTGPCASRSHQLVYRFEVKYDEYNVCIFHENEYVTIPALLPGQIWHVGLPVPPLATSGGDTIFVYVMLDVFNNVVETNESDNIFTRLAGICPPNYQRY